MERGTPAAMSLECLWTYRAIGVDDAYAACEEIKARGGKSAP